MLTRMLQVCYSSNIHIHNPGRVLFPFPFSLPPSSLLSPLSSLLSPVSSLLLYFLLSSLSPSLPPSSTNHPTIYYYSLLFASIQIRRTHVHDNRSDSLSTLSL